MSDRKIILIALGVAFALLLIYAISFIGTPISGQTSDWGAFGSYAAICVSSLSIALIYVTYREQRKTNEITRVEQHIVTMTNTLAILSEKLGVSIEFLQRLAGQVQANTEYSDATHQAGKTPQQREDEGRGLIGDNGKPLLNQEVEDYYLTGLSNGVDKLGERISPNQALRALALIQSPENYDILLKTKSPNEIATVITNLGRIAAGGVVGGNTSNTTVVPAKTPTPPANNANKTAPLINNAESPSANTDPNFYNLFGRQIPIGNIGNYTINQEQLGQVLSGQAMTTAEGIPYYIGGKTAVSPTQWLFGDATTQPFQLTAEDWASMQQQVGGVPVLLALPNNRYQQVLLNPDLAQRAGISRGQLLTIDKLYALQQAQGQ